MVDIPTKAGAYCQLSPYDYARQARVLDRNFSVVERHPDRVVLRLDFPGAGLSDGFSPAFLKHAQRYFRAVLPS